MSNLAKYALSALLLCQLTTDVKAVTTPSQPDSSGSAQINQEIEAYAKEYMHFLSVAKTERRAYAEAVRRLEAAGFKDISTVKSLKPGDKVYRSYHGKTLMACVIGSAPCAEGLRVVGAHIDSPRLDLKPRPIYAKGGIVYFDTHMYGGIKKFQWLVHPLALYGVIVRKDGTKAEVSVGDKPGDPVFMISDLLPHLARDQESKSQRDFYPAEDLDVIAGTLPVADKDGEKKPAAKQALVEFLKKEYNVTEEDLLSAELEIVPAGMPREVGFDRSLIAAYGQDDSACAYAGLSALLDVSTRKTPPTKTCALILCDKEEIGSTGASGMDSTFFENTVAELLDRQNAQARDIDIRRALERSTMLSADVTAATDPHFPDVASTGNEAHLNKGPAASKYTGGASKGGASDCRAEFVAEIRRIMDGAGVAWQMAELGKAEKGGGEQYNEGFDTRREWTGKGGKGRKTRGLKRVCTRAGGLIQQAAPNRANDWTLIQKTRPAGTGREALKWGCILHVWQGRLDRLLGQVAAGVQSDLVQELVEV